jgi:hypothetical protein
MARTWIAGPILAVALGVAACGGGSTGPQVADVGGGGKTSAAATTSMSPQDALLTYARCMRQHGVNIPDPQPGQGQISLPPGVPRERSQAALQACQTYLLQGLGKDPGDPAAEDRAVQQAQCLRQHGLDVPDPQPGRPLVLHGDPNDPKTKQAMQECRQPSGGTTKVNG